MFDRTLWTLSAVLSGLVLFRLVRERLWRKPPFSAFSVMLVAMLLRDVVLFAIPVQSLRYTIAWELTLIPVLVAQAWAGLSCYQSIAGLYPKIGKFAVKLFAAALFTAAILSFVALPMEILGLRTEPILRSFYLCYRWTDSLLAGGLILAAAFLSRFPSPMKKVPTNLLRHTALLASYFALYAIANLVPAWRVTTDLIRMGLVCTLYGIWSIALSAKGEASEPWPPAGPKTDGRVDQRDAAARAFFAGK